MKAFINENSVVQVNETGPKEFVGCFVIVTKVEQWGIQGHVPVPNGKGNVWINLEWAQLEYIGKLF
jgi:hypothetical protein